MAAGSFLDSRPAAVGVALAQHWRQHVDRDRRSARRATCVVAATRAVGAVSTAAAEAATAKAATANTNAVADDNDGGGSCNEDDNGSSCSSSSAAGSLVADWLDDVDSSDDDVIGSDATTASATVADAASTASPLPAGMEPAVELVRRFAASCGRPPRVLDIGCGDGALLTALHDMAVRRWGAARASADPHAVPLALCSVLLSSALYSAFRGTQSSAPLQAVPWSFLVGVTADDQASVPAEGRGHGDSRE